MADDVLELAGNLPFGDEMWEAWRRDPSSVDPTWRRMFENGAPAQSGGNGKGNNGVEAARAQMAAARPATIDAPLPVAASETARFMRIYGLVNAYRVRGHMEARLDPLDHLPRETHPDLDPGAWGFTESDLDRVMPSGG